MASIKQMLNRFETLDTDKVIQETMQESADTLADLNAEQINTGLKADGTEMPDYSFRSVFQYGKPPGPIRLRDTGAWQAGLYAKVQGDKVVFESTDDKDKMLTDRYGDNIKGLSEKYKAEAIREKVRPVFKNKMQQATGLLMK
jgi:hypothetical protein